MAHLGLLRSALWGSPRIVTYGSSQLPSDLPPAFEFTSRCIFAANVIPSKNDAFKAVLSHSPQRRQPMSTDLTVTTGWGQGRKARFLGFADGEGGLAFQNVGPSTTVITALPRKGDAIVEMDGEQTVTTPLGAFFGVYGPQSGTESRTSSLMTPLNDDGLGCCATAVETTIRLSPKLSSQTESQRAVLGFMICPSSSMPLGGTSR